MSKEVNNQGRKHKERRRKAKKKVQHTLKQAIYIAPKSTHESRRISPRAHMVPDLTNTYNALLKVLTFWACISHILQPRVNAHEQVKASTSFSLILFSS